MRSNKTDLSVIWLDKIQKCHTIFFNSVVFPFLRVSSPLDSLDWDLTLVRTTASYSNEGLVAATLKTYFMYPYRTDWGRTNKWSRVVLALLESVGIASISLDLLFLAMSNQFSHDSSLFPLQHQHMTRHGNLFLFFSCLIRFRIIYYFILKLIYIN